MMMIKVALASVAAAALCAPAMAPAVAASGPAVSNVAFSAPMKKHHNDDNCRGGINVCGNTVQVPIQACNNNVLSNIGLGLLGGHGSAKGGNNKGKCSQNTSSKHN